VANGLQAQALGNDACYNFAKAHPGASFGSYPFFDDASGPNTNVVVRSRDPDVLAVAKSAVEDMLASVKARLKAS
jgi:hypothetical protein